MMLRIGVISATAAVLPLLGCSSQKRSASLEIGDPFTKEVYSVRGNIVSKKWVANGKVKSQLHAVRTNEDLTPFWKSIEVEQVRKWLPVYLPAEKTRRTGSTSWCITLSEADISSQSSGGGAFPSDADLTRSVGPDSSDRFARVVKAFDLLVSPGH